MEKEPITQDILEAINHFATDVENQFTEVKTDIKLLKQDVTGIKATMVTKSYLDDKMADLREDLVGLVRKEDSKIDAFVKVAADEVVIAKKSAQKILSMGPFPKI